MRKSYTENSEVFCLATKCEVACRIYGYAVKFSVPPLSCEAHFTHAVRFTSEGRFSFRVAEHLVEKSTLSRAFFWLGRQDTLCPHYFDRSERLTK